MVQTEVNSQTTPRMSWWVGAFVIPIGLVVANLGITVLSKLLGRDQYNYDTDTAKMLVGSIPWLVLWFVILAGLWRWSRWTLQGPRIRWTNEVWLVVGGYLAFGLITFVQSSRGGGAPDTRLLAGVVVAGLLVGINEELAFRGFSINGFARKLPVFWAVTAAAVIFGLCHSFNVFYGSAPSRVAMQVVFTIASGLTYGWQKYRAQTLEQALGLN
jgi:membrane protease YdiL (CAAX protease family)